MALSLVNAGCDENGSSESGPDVLTGTVVAVDAQSLTNIDSFTLRTEDDDLEIYIDDSLDYSESGFLPQHLREHVISAIRVRVEVEQRGDRLIAVGMKDA